MKVGLIMEYEIQLQEFKKLQIQGKYSIKTGDQREKELNWDFLEIWNSHNLVYGFMIKSKFMHRKILCHSPCVEFILKSIDCKFTFKEQKPFCFDMLAPHISLWNYLYSFFKVSKDCHLTNIHGLWLSSKYISNMKSFYVKQPHLDG